jgi:hypothetical protein
MDVLVAIVIALAGGSVGAFITLVARVPEQVRHHNRLVTEYDEDLGQWVADEMVRLERAFERHKNEAARNGQLYSGAYLRGIAHLKEEALHAYRDQETAAKRRRAALRDAEGWVHRKWREIRAGPLRELDAPDEVRPLLDMWRQEVRRDGDTAPGERSDAALPPVGAGQVSASRRGDLA